MSTRAADTGEATAGSSLAAADAKPQTVETPPFGGVSFCVAANPHFCDAELAIARKGRLAEAGDASEPAATEARAAGCAFLESIFSRVYESSFRAARRAFADHVLISLRFPWRGRGLGHARLTTMLPALILSAFQVVFLLQIVCSLARRSSWRKPRQPAGVPRRSNEREFHFGSNAISGGTVDLGNLVRCAELVQPVAIAVPFVNSDG